MAKQYVMALDAGTTSNRAIIFDRNSKIVGVSQKEFTQYFPKPGWVEHDAEEIWSTMVTVMKEALEQSGLVASDIAGIGITNQRETAVVWAVRFTTPSSGSPARPHQSLRHSRPRDSWMRFATRRA